MQWCCRIVVVADVELSWRLQLEVEMVLVVARMFSAELTVQFLVLGNCVVLDE